MVRLGRFFVEVRGLVEGVGFRPFVYRIAKKLGLSGWVKNDSKGVYIQVEGEVENIEKFLEIIKNDYPRVAEVFEVKVREVEVLGEKEFRILPSTSSQDKLPVIPPDIAICSECRNELFDVENKRFYYPFINCTNCGPRFSIIRDVPYDRCNTSMNEFEMCYFCRDEYNDIENRRFHAQPVACFECGPYIELFDSDFNRISLDYPLPESDRKEYTKNVIEIVSELILQGNIVALKGIGGFQLVCRADDDIAVRNLRLRKKREEKPFAVMFRNLEDIKKYCFVSEKEERIITSYISPIVLLRKKSNIGISSFVSPRNPFLGCMLPYSPLHLLLMERVNVPIVCTSANLSDEPICIDNNEAFERLKGIADFFLIHNRKIVRHVDDSVVKVTPRGNEIIIRRARGFVPKPILLESKLPPTLAVGGHLKNTIAIGFDEFVIVSQHIGDLETFESIKAFEKTIQDFMKFYDFKPRYVVCDLHPDYISTQFAERFSQDMKVNLVKLQHHFAHVLSVIAENNIFDKDVIGVAWDGTGFGTDGEVWGSEFLFVSKGKFERLFHLLPIPLIGGEKAIKEVYRIGIGLLLSSDLRDEAYRIFGNEKNFKQIVEMYSKGLYVNSSGAGRLFDGVSAIIGISRYSSFEGQSAMELEFSLYSSENINEEYEYDLSGNLIDWRKIVLGIVEDLKRGLPNNFISLKFHKTVVRIILDCIFTISRIKNCNNVVLSGGVFQNSFILDSVVEKLRESSMNVFVNQKVPPNDGGISLGQVFYSHYLGSVR
ncbi:MAG: carbamoyltransferase HypF [Brevinematia bacterium]